MCFYSRKVLFFYKKLKFKRLFWLLAKRILFFRQKVRCKSVSFESEKAFFMIKNVFLRKRNIFFSTIDIFWKTYKVLIGKCLECTDFDFLQTLCYYIYSSEILPFFENVYICIKGIFFIIKNWCTKYQLVIIF